MLRIVKIFVYKNFYICSSTCVHAQESGGNMSSRIGSSNNQTRYAVFHAATNIYALDYRRFSHIANQMEPFAELLSKRILDQTPPTTEECRGFETQLTQFKSDWQHTAQLASVLADLAYAYETLLPVGDESDLEVQTKINKMKQGKTNILVLNAEVEVLKSKMEAGCLKIERLMKRLQIKMDGFEDGEEDESDLNSPPKVFTYLPPSSSSSSSSTSTSSHMSPTYDLPESVTEDIHDTLMDKFDLDLWKKEAEALRLLEEQSSEIDLPAFSPVPTHRNTPPLQEPSPLSLQPVSETPSSQSVQIVSDRVQKLLLDINLLIEREALLQRNFPIQTKPRTPPVSGSLRSISAPASTTTSRRPSVTLTIIKPDNPKIETSPSPENDREVFTGKEEMPPTKDAMTEPSSTLADPTPTTPLIVASSTTTATSEKRKLSSSDMSDLAPSTSLIGAASKAEERCDADPTSQPLQAITTKAQYPLSFIAEPPPPPQSPKKLHPSAQQKTREKDVPIQIIRTDEPEESEPERVTFPTTKKKPDRSCGVSIAEWWKSCFSSRKVTDIEVNSK